MEALPLIATVFVASLLGSLHCAGMCGAFVLFAVGGPRTRGGRFGLHAAYHGGRFVTYTALGVFAGFVGATFDFGGSLVGVQRFAAVLAGAMMILFGLGAIARMHAVRIPKVPIPAAWQRLLTRAHEKVAGRPPFERALITGLLTTLLPCGWLWAFVISAAGTGSPAYGALTMAAFWAGTLPVLVTLGAGIRAIAGPLGARLPTITAAAVVVVGVATVAGRFNAITPETAGGHCPLCETAASGGPAPAAHALGGDG